MALPDQWTITGCSVKDGAMLAANNVPAFWADPHWALTWQHTTMEDLIPQLAKRFTRNLLNNRDVNRHQKLIDTATGRILGYARWSLPPQYGALPDAAWPEAVVPSVSVEEETKIRAIADAVHWDPNLDTDVFIPPVKAIREPLLAKKPYMQLLYLAVHPDNQGRGVGTALVQSGMKVAQDLGLDIFIHAQKMGLRLYQRLGFQLVAEITQDDSKCGGPGDYWNGMMIYEQRSNGNVGPSMDD